MKCNVQQLAPRNSQVFRLWMALGIVGILTWFQFLLPASGQAQNYVLTTAVLVNSQNSTGYSTSTTTPGEYQRFTERYLEHLQIPYELFDVATQSPPDLSTRQLIIAGHRGLSLSSSWQSAITNAVESGIGFVNLDWATNIGQQSHIQAIFGATGSAAGTAATSIRVPEALLQGQATPHFITGMQRKFLNAPAGDIVYNFHVDGAGALPTATSTLLTVAQGVVIAQLGTDPLILATNFGQGRAVHFGTLDYLRADRFGFFMGVDDLFWRSLVWAARKPFVVRGFPRWWSVQMDDTLPGWPDRVRDMYDTTFTGTVAGNGIGGPWRVTGYAFTDYLAPGSADRATAIADINAGRLHVFPHSRGGDYGSLFWETPAQAQLTDATWLATIGDIQTWLQGNGGTDTIPFLSRSMVPHFWNLSNLTGYDLWNTLGVRYITEIQRPGIDFFNKTDADRLRLRPVRRYEIPPSPSLDENYPVYIADDYVVGSRTGLPAQTFFNFATQIIDLTRYDRQDVAWPNTTRPVNISVDQFQHSTWRLWSSLAPTQIYTHDGSNNYILATPAQRQAVIQQVSSWLNQNGARHTFMGNLGDYMYARTKSNLTSGQFISNEVTLSFSGTAATADSAPITTEVLFFNGDNEGTSLSVPGFSGGSTVTLSVPSNPLPTTTSATPSTMTAGGPAFTLTVTGTGFVNGATVRWNGTNRTSTFVSSTQLTAVISASDIATGGTAQVTVFNPAPGGGVSNAQAVNLNNPVPTTTSLSPNSASVGSTSFTLTVLGNNFVGTSEVRWNGSARPTTFVSSSQVTATISAADVATTGTVPVSVFNPIPGGGISNSQTFTVNTQSNPVPVAATLNPTTRTAGSGAFTLTVTGSDFIANSVVRWNGVNRSTTFVSATQLTAAILAGDVASAGTAQVTIENPAPGGGISNALTVTILASDTFLDDFNRADAANLGNSWVEKTPAAFSITTNRVAKAATSSTFVNNLVYRPATENMLDGEASIEFRLASTTPGYPQVFLRGQTASIGTAGTFNGYLLFVDNAINRAFLERIENGNFFQLAQLNLNPTLNTTDTYRLRMRATGTSPVALQAFVERLNGVTWDIIGLAAVNDNAATRFATAGTVGFSGHTEGNTYTYDNFVRFSLDGGASSNPTPTITTITPAAATAGGAGFILTVTGSNFVNGAVVQWNGINRTTTFVSAAQLSATIPASDILTPSTATITVFNPTPGGGTSNSQLFAILDPSGTFSDNFNRANNGTIGNGWTEKYPTAFSIQNNEVVSIDTNPIDYHDTIVYRPLGEDQLDTEVDLEFRILPGLNFPQVHARVQRNTLPQANTIESYIFFVDGFEPLPGRAIIARQPAVAGQFECYILGIPFSTPLQQNTRYRLRFQVTGANPVTLTGIVERLNGTVWELFASGTTMHTNSTQPDPNLYCNPGFMPPPLSTPGAVGFAKWTTANEILDNFSWTNLGVATPVPTTTSLAPASATAGGPAFTLIVNGTNFVNGSVVRWNGANRTTTFVSATQLTAAIPATDIITAGTAQVTVFNPTPGGGTANAQTFTINAVPNPVPTMTNLAPTSATAGSAALMLTVNGTNFVPGSAVRWNGTDRTTTFVSATQLTATIPATDIATAGTAQVTVFNTAPGGGTANAQTFTINAVTNPVPTTTSLAPTSAAAGSPAFTLTVNGTNFVNGSAVRWNGTDRTTTFVSATQLTAAIPATDIATAGTAQVTVFNAAPGGGTANAQTFTINASFNDNFDRANGATIGNGWIEKNPAAFSLANNTVTKASTASSFIENFVYRPTTENILNVEASIAVRFVTLPPQYPQVFVRGQTNTIATAGTFNGYLLFINNNNTSAFLDRIENGNFFVLSQFNLISPLNTTDAFRLRLRATGTNPVVLTAYVERLNGTTWEVIGQANVNDTAATRFSTAGTVGFSGHTEGGVYTYDNFFRTTLP
jgi:hypothetical protein